MNVTAIQFRCEMKAANGYGCAYTAASDVDLMAHYRSHHPSAETVQLLTALVELAEQQMQLAREEIELLMRIEAKLGSEKRSSVELKTSARGVDITAKAYEGSDIREPGDAVLEEYGRQFREVTERKMREWSDTFVMVSAERNGA